MNLLCLGWTLLAFLRDVAGSWGLGRGGWCCLTLYLGDHSLFVFVCFGVVFQTNQTCYCQDP